MKFDLEYIKQHKEQIIKKTGQLLYNALFYQVDDANYYEDCQDIDDMDDILENELTDGEYYTTKIKKIFMKYVKEQ